MIKSIQHLPLSATLSVLTLILACGGSHHSSSSTSTTPYTTTVSATKRMASLSVGAYETLAAETGKCLTLTVDGIETPIESGKTYTSASSTGVVLEVTEAIPVTYTSSMGGSSLSYDYRAAAYIQNGYPVLEKSVTSAITNLTLGNGLTQLDGPSIQSIGPDFNGIYIDSTGNDSVSEANAFAVNNASINLLGHSDNDFAGHGAAICTAGYSAAVINNPTIITQGYVRPAIIVREHSEAWINNGYIKVSDGVLPAGYVFSSSPGSMWKAPAGLGLDGNCRATIVLDNAKAHYNNCTIEPEGWGALSTDMNSGCEIDATNCKVKFTGTAGYAGFAIGSCTATYTSCEMEAPTYGVVLAMGAGSAVLHGGTVSSDRIGVMVWGGNVGTLTVDQNASISAAKALIQLKSSFTTIDVDGATLSSTSGMIMEVAQNDDTGMGSTANSNTTPNSVSFKNVSLAGDIVHGYGLQMLNVILGDGATLTGAVTTASFVRATTTTSWDSSNYTLVGDFTYTPAAFGTTYTDISGTSHAVTGYLCLTLNSGATWNLKDASATNVNTSTSMYLDKLVLSGGEITSSGKTYTISGYLDGSATLTTYTVTSSTSTLPTSGTLTGVTISSNS